MQNEALMHRAGRKGFKVRFVDRQVSIPILDEQSWQPIIHTIYH